MRSSTDRIHTNDVENFIENELRKKISHEFSLGKFGIVSEADLQAVAYFYLKQYLKRDNRYKVYNRIYLRRKRVYPDIVILRKEAVPRIAIEFKEHQGLNKKDVIEDARKLFKFRKMRRGYLIYMTRDEESSSEKLTGMAECYVAHYRNKVTPLVINAFDNIRKNQRGKWKQYWKKYSAL